MDTRPSYDYDNNVKGSTYSKWIQLKAIGFILATAGVVIFIFISYAVLNIKLSLAKLITRK